MLDVNMLFLVSEEEVEKLIEEGVVLLGEVGMDRGIIDAMVSGCLEQRVSFIGVFLPMLAIDYLQEQAIRAKNGDESINILDLMKQAVKIKTYNYKLEKCITFVGKDVIHEGI